MMKEEGEKETAEISRACIVYEIKPKTFRRKIKSQMINAKIFSACYSRDV
jgi:hypothetical protein